MSGKKEELVQATDPSSSKFKYETKLVNLRRYVIFCNFPWAHHTIWVQLKTWIVWLCNNGWFPAILKWVSKLLKFYAQQKLRRKFIYFTQKYHCLFIQVLSWLSKSKQGLNQVYDDWKIKEIMMARCTLDVLKIEKFVTFRHFNFDFKSLLFCQYWSKTNARTFLFYSIFISCRSKTKNQSFDWFIFVDQNGLITHELT